MVRLVTSELSVSSSSPQLFTLGLDSQFGTVQGVIQAAVDLKLFPESVRKEFQTGERGLAQIPGSSLGVF